MRLFGSISKYDQQQDGSVIIEGIASTECVDSQGESVRASAIRDALPEFMKFGNIREMHQASAIGVALSTEVQDNDHLFVRAKIVDSEAVKKITCTPPVYKGFSIGGKSLAKNGNVITKLRLGEISVVDRPANPECVFELAKVDWEAIEKKGRRRDDDDDDDDEGEHEYDHEDHYSKYGDVEYADPAHHKYPIDTEKHVRAALSYFAMARNHNKYSPAEQSHIHARIAAAAHRHGITLSPEDTKKYESFMNDQVLQKVDGIATTLATITDRLTALEKSAVTGETITKMQTAIGDVTKQLSDTREAAVTGARNDIITKMGREGKAPINPSTKKGYTVEELAKLDLPTLEIISANAPVVPLRERSLLSGDIRKSEPPKGPDGKELTGMARATAVLSERFPNLDALRKAARNGE